MLLSSIQQEGEAAAASSASIKTATSSQAESEWGFWAEFPEDLIFEILCRLPEKDLILLKSVSKGWNFVISRICIPRLSSPSPRAPFWGLLCFKDPLPPPDTEEAGEDQHNNPSVGDQFLKLYFLNLDRYVYGEFSPPSFCVRRIEHLFMSLLPKELEEYDPSGIRDCCNGLLLLASSRSSRYYVANPVTKQRLLIPINYQHSCNTNIKTIHSSLVFDPSLSLEFKIVTFIRPAGHATATLPMELDIFCSETGQWCSHVLPLEPHGLNGFEWLCRSVYFNRGLYSLSFAMFLVCIDNLIPSPSRITSRSNMDYGGFDLKAWAIELPDKDLILSELLPHCCGCIGVSSGCFYYSNRDAGGSSMFVWMLVYKGRNSEWVLLHTINIADDLVQNLLGGVKHVNLWKHFDCFRPRAFLPKDDTLVIAAPKLVISYDLKIKLADVLWIPHTPWNCNRKTLHLDGNWIFPFSPCLLILNCIVAENLGE